MRTFIIVFFLASMMFLTGCEKRINIEAEKAAISKIMAEADQELLDGVLKKDTTDTSTSINIMEGKLTRLTAAETYERNQSLLDRGEFVKIENLEDPIINVSPDGQMAWVAVKTKFMIAYTDSLGMEKEWEGVEARLEVYEKKNNKWSSVATAQTY